MRSAEINQNMYVHKKEKNGTTSVLVKLGLENKCVGGGKYQLKTSKIKFFHTV